jgi:imidazolonepropionase-like amidohydrolase
MIIALAALLTAACARTPALPDYPVFALYNGLLIDGNGAEPIADAVVVVRDGQIVAAGRSDSVAIPKDAERIDVGGATILPGFINTHVHQGYTEGNLRKWAREGVTSVRDLGAQYSQGLFGQRDSLREEPQNAFLVSAGPMLTVPNGYPMVPWGAKSGMTLTSMEDLRTKVNGLLDDGADVLKLAMESGIVFEQNIPSLTVEMASEIVQIAHTRNIPVSAHVLASSDLERALDAGADNIAHMVVDQLPAELIDRMVQNQIVWVPTLELWHGVGSSTFDAALANTKRFVEAGGLVALGTDYAGYSSEFDLGMPMREVGWMHQAGMTPMQIIQAATRIAARISNRGDQTGAIEASKSADILVVTGNPLDDLQALGRVKMVVSRGKIIRWEKP